MRLWDIRWSLIKLNHDVPSLAHADPPVSSFSLESTTRYFNGSILWYFPTGHLLSLLTFVLPRGCILACSKALYPSMSSYLRVPWVPFSGDRFAAPPGHADNGTPYKLPDVQEVLRSIQSLIDFHLLPGVRYKESTAIRSFHVESSFDSNIALNRHLFGGFAWPRIRSDVPNRFPGHRLIQYSRASATGDNCSRHFAPHRFRALPISNQRPLDPCRQTPISNSPQSGKGRVKRLVMASSQEVQEFISLEGNS